MQFFVPLCVGTTNTHCVSRRSRSHCRVCEQRTLFWLVPWENCCAATEAVPVCWWRQVKSVSLASRGCPALTVITTAIQMLLWHFDTGRVCVSVCILGFCIHMPAYIHGCCVSCACQCDFVTNGRNIWLEGCSAAEWSLYCFWVYLPFEGTELVLNRLGSYYYPVLCRCSCWTNESQWDLFEGFLLLW